MTRTARQHLRGMTLTELMIAVAIVGVLAAVAFPSYQRYAIRANRADAQKALLAAAQGMERNFIAFNTYQVCSAPCTLPTTAGTSNGAFVAQSPESGTAIYTLSLQAATATSYTLQATPSTSSINKTDGCLRIDNSGLRTWNGVQSSTGCGSTYSKSWTDRE